MLIKVTQEHIDKGIQCAAQKCVLALAIADATKAEYVAVLFSTCQIDEHCYLMPEAMRDIRREFDIYGRVEPTEFELPMVPYVDPSDPGTY